MWRPSRAWLITLATVLLPASAIVSSAHAAAAAAPTVIVSNDFEDATAQGWFGRGSAAVMANNAAAHGGTYSLRTTGRTATWNGPAVNLASKLLTGATYGISAYVQLVAGQPAAALHVTMQRTPNGGTTTFDPITSASVTDTGWVHLVGEYTVPSDSSELQLYVESDDATVQYDLDDFQVTEVSPPPNGPPDQAGVTSTFETGTTQGWAPRIGSEQLTATTAAAHSGQYSLLIAGRTATYAGPSLNLLGKVSKGSKYTFSVWLRLAPGEPASTMRLSIERRLQGTPSYETLVGNTTVTDAAWVHFAGAYTLGFDVDFLSAYAESASGTPSFYLDDFEMAYVRPLPIQTDIPSVKDVLGTNFLVGAAVTPAQLLGVHGQLLSKHFSSVTPGNEMKWDATEPTEGQFTFAAADAIVNYAKANGIKVRGHTLAWHSQVPSWLFKDAAGNDMTPTPENKALLLTRLENHIRALAGRYADDIYAWDVANEVVDELQPDGMRRSPWFVITGLDYLRTAFRVAHEVAPKAELCLNDYNTEQPLKRQAVFNLVKKLIGEGVPVNCVGHQFHINMERPTAEAIDQTIQQFTSLGVDQQVTELDISVYNNFTDMYDTVPASVFALQGYRYRDIFNVFKRERAHLSSVTVWGLADDDTWLSNFPITRLNPPLLFDDQLQAKPAYWGLVDPTKLPPVTRTLTVPAGGTCLGGANDAEWKLLPPTIITTPSGAFEHFQMRWDKRFLYVRGDVADSTNDRADKVEFYVDDNNAKTTAYEADDAHYTLKRDGSHSASFLARTERISGGYRVEAALPLRTPGVVDRALGFDLRVTDASRPGEVASWNDSTNSQDTDTSKWGTLNLATAVSLVDARRGTPAVDGVVDSAWARAPEITTGVRIQGPDGATATARVLWDDHHIYILAKVTDPVLDESSPNSWEQDSVEFFVDPNNAKTAGYEDDDGQYRVSFTNKQTISSNFGAYAIANNLKSATTLIPGGYLVEASIEVNTVPVARGALLGFDLQVNDATAGARTAAATWHDPTSLSYLNTSRWGVVRLD